MWAEKAPGVPPWEAGGVPSDSAAPDALHRLQVPRTDTAGTSSISISYIILPQQVAWENARRRKEVKARSDGARRHPPPPPPTRPKLPPQLSQEKILHLNAQGKNISECMHQAALAAGRNRVSLWKNREGFKIQT